MMWNRIAIISLGLLLGGHGGRFRLQIFKNHKPDERSRRKGGQKLGGGKNEQPAGIYRAPKYASLCRGEGPYAAVKPHYLEA